MKKVILTVMICLTLFAAPREGDKQVAYTLPLLYKPAKVLSNSEMRGKVVLLNLWASWCSGCQEEMPLFVALQKRHNKKDFIVVAASIDSVDDNAKEFLNRVDPDKNLIALYDVKKSLPKAYRCPGLPSSFLIDKEGKIAAVYIGSLDKAMIKDLEKKIAELERK
ncbi:TlpA family protein disulfide reductase [Sulfurimonas sediminis]|uniref:TlpA family protein disulfide reductase n=1 Tax=Sulfurimonas sediminis TaxID=2590020 RepID=A0A7M1AYG5_9BACT|nr:TlpA disulfide reductase family protein [Sulfurimonas sediminis]QOP42519.1 TlpA family protein disulfide reductase [Sulfurimonas sediminis]